MYIEAYVSDPRFDAAYDRKEPTDRSTGDILLNQ